MSLRWSSYIAPKPPKGSSKTQCGRFPSKIALHLKKVCYKVSLCENCQRQSCKAFIGLTIREKNNWWRTSPSTWNFGSNWPRWSEIADVRSVFVRSASAVTPSEKSSINTNRKSTTRFPMNPRWTSYVVLMLPKGGSGRKVSSVWTISCEPAITPKRYEIGCQLLLITNRKSHTGFWLIPTSMALNYLERRNSPYFAFFHRVRLLYWPVAPQWLNIDL